MGAQTISQVSRGFGISTRMLRYYEQEGLIGSFRQDGYAYRMYDEKAVSRLEQIQILRKLRLPLKQIKFVLQRPDAITAIEIFEKNIAELNGEIVALTIIKNILAQLVQDLERTADIQLQHLLNHDNTILTAIEPLSAVSIRKKEENVMSTLERAEEQLNKLTDVRIVYLPPATVASAHHVGDDPEKNATSMMADFVRTSGLLVRKPDLRHFGFNHPNPVDETGYHGYEVWVTIPEDMEGTITSYKKAPIRRLVRCAYD